MDRFIEFAVNHWILVSVFIGLLVAVLVNESRRGGRGVSSQQLTHLINRDSAVVIDVREVADYEVGHITGSLNIPYARLTDSLGQLDQHKQVPVILVCKMGQHSGEAGRILHAAGFEDVRRLTGGVGSWTADGLPLVKAS